mgnify:CR=1 FL=1
MVTSRSRTLYTLVGIFANERLDKAILDLAGDTCCIEAKIGEEQVHLALLDEFVGYAECERIYLELFFTQNFAHCFTRTTAWGEYEGIQSDVFDHVLAVIPEFDLRVFQNPSGSDIEALRYQRPEPDVPAKPDVTEKSSASPE